jgi:hypothetical protein
LGNFNLSGGLSFLQGGWKNATKYVHQIRNDSQGVPYYSIDSSLANLQKIAPRKYRGADIQLTLNHAWGESEIRAEYWAGTQPGTYLSTTNPGYLPSVNGEPAPTYLREFNGGFLLFLQQLFNPRHQLMAKYDWYDPNIKVSAHQIGSHGSLNSEADIRFDTWGFGYSYQLNKETKFTAYFDRVRNEHTMLAPFLKDLSDNVLTFRLQFRF